ncbi:MAG: rod shape-determining protein MreC [Actinomycetota bacterium]|nr:rod shape-determining protein MreC [Actinomycetota bacterium]
MRPFEVGAERVARPFRDAYGWMHDLVVARSENERLREENAALRAERIKRETVLRKYEQLKRQVRFRSPPLAADYTRLYSTVLAQPTQYRQEVKIDGGSADGIRKYSPVVTVDGLVGHVTLVYPHVSKVTLITDRDSAVAARDERTNAWGIVQRGQGSEDSLILHRVEKSKTVYRGDRIVTAGSSIYPEGIGIGEVRNVGHTSSDVFKRIQIRPYVDMSSLDTLIVLMKPRTNRNKR